MRNNVRSAPGRQPPPPSRSHFASWIPGISTSEVPTSWKKAMHPPHAPAHPTPHPDAYNCIPDIQHKRTIIRAILLTASKRK